MHNGTLILVACWCLRDLRLLNRREAWSLFSHAYEQGLRFDSTQLRLRNSAATHLNSIMDYLYLLELLKTIDGVISDERRFEFEGRLHSTATYSVGFLMVPFSRQVSNVSPENVGFVMPLMVPTNVRIFAIARVGTG